MSYDYRNVQYGVSQQNAAIIEADLRRQIQGLKQQQHDIRGQFKPEDVELLRRIADFLKRGDYREDDEALTELADRIAAFITDNPFAKAEK